MKLPELKEKLKNKYTVRIVAGVLVIALAGTALGTSAFTVKASNNTETVETVADSSDSSDIELDGLLDKVSVSSDKVDKEESVYIITDASGNPTQTIVTEHLTNKDGAATIEDETKLTDISNVKGNETFTQNGTKLTWQADGNEIYYQGKTNEQAPLKQKVSYKLDGKDISPEELAGKSGKVTIRFDYENTTKYTETVNGEEVTVCVPFAALSTLMLDDHFSNIEVTNGKIKENGDKNIVIGYAVPGLTESLDIDEDKLEDVNIPEYFEVTADVNEFELSTAMTFVVNATEYLSMSGSLTDDIDDVIDDLTGATDQLIDGSDQLSDGATQLSDGATTLADGTQTLKDGADTLASGADTLESGLSTLKKSLKPFASGMTTLKSGLTAYLDGASQINDGIQTLYDGTGSLVGGANTLNTSAKSISDAIATLDATLNAKMTDEEKAAIVAQAETAAKKAVDDSYAAGTQAQVAETIYKGLRYKADGTDGELYLTLYTSGIKAKYEESSDAGYALAVKETLKKAAETYDAATKVLAPVLGVAPFDTSACQSTSDYASCIKNGLTAIAANNAALQAVPDAMLPADKKAALAQMAVLSQVVGGMSDAQMAEFYFAQQDDVNITIHEYVDAQVDAGMATDGAKAEAQTTVEDALHKIADTLATGTKDVATQAATQAASTAAVTSVTTTKATVAAGIEKVQDNGYSLVTGAQALSAGTQSLVESLPALTSGVEQLLAGSNTLVSNNKALKSGIKELAGGTTKITSGVDKLAKGSTKLSDGADTLAEGAGDLNDGANKLAEGASELNDGAEKLADGMVEFNNEGIEKIVNAYYGDLKPFANRLQALIDAGSSYNSYAGISEKATGSVKFIYKLGAIEVAEEK